MPYDFSSPDTHWVFLSDSTEPRHLSDIVFAISVLRQRGVNGSRVSVFTSDPSGTARLKPFGCNVGPLTAVSAGIASTNGAEHLVVVVGGHGTNTGLGPVSPAALLNAVRSAPDLQLGLIVLGQCFAGVFHFLDAATKPELVLVGATNLHNSLSLGVKLQTPIKSPAGTTELESWNANLFLLHFFAWLLKPTDIDGDGAITVVDAYKEAGIHSNQHLIRQKCRLYIEAGELRSALVKLDAQLKGSTEPMKKDELKLRRTALEKMLQDALVNLHVHQEPWLLNANTARRVHF